MALSFSTIQQWSSELCWAHRVAWALGIDYLKKMVPLQFFFLSQAVFPLATRWCQ